MLEEEVLKLVKASFIEYIRKFIKASFKRYRLINKEYIKLLMVRVD